MLEILIFQTCLQDLQTVDLASISLEPVKPDLKQAWQISMGRPNFALHSQVFLKFSKAILCITRLIKELDVMSAAVRRI